AGVAATVGSGLGSGSARSPTSASGVADIVAVGTTSVGEEAGGAVATSALGTDSSPPPHAVNNAPTMINASNARAGGNDAAVLGNRCTQKS
ncbi:MAG: hypothetical protein KTV68_18115, partial [Acidimicrobiia bacterium]|nr:hypothetical protein [Acidimicrobiia bacterium]